MPIIDYKIYSFKRPSLISEMEYHTFKDQLQRNPTFSLNPRRRGFMEEFFEAQYGVDTKIVLYLIGISVVSFLLGFFLMTVSEEKGWISNIGGFFFIIAVIGGLILLFAILGGILSLFTFIPFYIQRDNYYKKLEKTVRNSRSYDEFLRHH